MFRSRFVVWIRVVSKKNRSFPRSTFIVVAARTNTRHFIPTQNATSVIGELLTRARKQTFHSVFRLREACDSVTLFARVQNFQRVFSKKKKKQKKTNRRLSRHDVVLVRFIRAPPWRLNSKTRSNAQFGYQAAGSINYFVRANSTNLYCRTRRFAYVKTIWRKAEKKKTVGVIY